MRPGSDHDLRPPLRSFRKRGRMTEAKRDALARLGERFLVDLDAIRRSCPSPIPVVLDIGFGDGEATVAYARAHPHVPVLAIEVHRPGIAALVQQLERHDLDSVRVFEGDVLDVLGALPEASVAEIHLFFPDPWPKIRHRARRLVRPEVVARWAEVLVPGGAVHLATDSDDYATQMRTVLDAEPRFGPVVADRAGRPSTKYERLALAAGRIEIHDLRSTTLPAGAY